ncbi:hypothetical protein ISO99_09250 [Staphylococcus sp. 18_1_E_LY]|nr:hypothetical protein [Staphylococcus lloydii]MBF7020091.1 hypothetical protein [Staphylococcus lloydii]MBF7027774.1 hypothetical protein [Staphylococcus lloydii]MDU9418570.1 hypothetical protein [Staphylococcus lloydii]
MTDSFILHNKKRSQQFAINRIHLLQLSASLQLEFAQQLSYQEQLTYDT